MKLGELRDMAFVYMTIIEHRGDGENIVGEIAQGRVDIDGSLSVYWNHAGDRLQRTTIFLPSSWKCEIVAGVIFLKRIAQNPSGFDVSNPWGNANLYTIFRQAQ